MTEEDPHTRKTLRPTVGTPSELTVSELTDVWHRAALKYLMVGYVREYMDSVRAEFRGEAKGYIHCRALADAVEWRSARMGKILVNLGHCSALDAALETACHWVTEVAANTTGLGAIQHQNLQNAVRDFHATVSSSLVELVREECQ